MAFPVLTFTGTVGNSGNNTIVTNPFKTVVQAQTHGQQRGAIVRVISYYVQNLTGAAVNVAWQDSSGTNLAGPFQVPAVPGNWSERASVPAFLFETTRSNTTFVGYDLVLNLNTASNCQVFCEYMFSFVPGRVGQ